MYEEKFLDAIVTPVSLIVPWDIQNKIKYIFLCWFNISILAYKNSCYMVHWLGIARANAKRQCSLKLLVRAFFSIRMRLLQTKIFCFLPHIHHHCSLSSEKSKQQMICQNVSDLQNASKLVFDFIWG